MHMSRKRKASLRARASEMTRQKVERRLSSNEDTSVEVRAGPSEEISERTTSPTTEESSSVAIVSFEDLPAPLELNMSDEEVNEDEDFEDKIAEDEIHAIYEDWLSDMKRTDKQKVTMIVYDNYIQRFGLTKTGAAEETGKLFGVNEKTIRRWRNEFLSNSGEFDEDWRGRHDRYHVMMDEQYRDIALEWVRQHASVKGTANMTSLDFCKWVDGTLLPLVREHHPHIPAKISLNTACRWLHKLGFQPSSTRKGVYIDGHERTDVIEYRTLYLRRLEILSSTHAPPPLCTDEVSEPFIGPQRRHLVLLFHDESTYHSNEDQGWMWAEKGNQPIKPKGQGRGIMVSDFVDEFNGLLSLTTEEFERGKLVYPDLKQKARALLKYGAEGEGYWNSDKFIAQVENVIKIVKIKYPMELYDVIWLFDHSSGHTAFAEDALNVNKMNVRPGGAQPKMRDTMWRGRVQRMVLPDGTPKGMKQVLIERGINVTKMKAEQMREVLHGMADFKYEKTRVETLLHSNSFKGYFIPKFHCELNPIERVWAQSKKFTRAHCDYTFHGLENTLDQSLDSIPLDTIRRFFRKMRDYLAAYREGLTLGPQMEAALKQYKSHRKVRE